MPVEGTQLWTLRKPRHTLRRQCIELYVEWINSTGCAWDQCAKGWAGYRVRHGRNGAVQQKRLAVASEEHTVTVHLSELVLSVCLNWGWPRSSLCIEKGDLVRSLPSALWKCWRAQSSIRVSLHFVWNTRVSWVFSNCQCSKSQSNRFQGINEI